ncbi:hypothetical protein R1flu_027738 [Riccia fluitans]|uniref:Uncharacterized protein n=1 Tax=Riccia fluitans TaxID=41844 RepID=A0ABD1XJS4_9MARC
MVCYTRNPSRKGTSRLTVDGNAGSYFQDEIRGPIAVIRGFELPADAKVAASVPAIWSILTPLSGSSIWGSLSSESVSTARTSVSLSRPGGGSDAVSTASTSYSYDADKSRAESSFGFTSAMSKFFTTLRGSTELPQPLLEANPEETQNISTPGSTNHISVSNSTAQASVMLSASSSTLTRSSISIRAGITNERSSSTFTTGSGVDVIEKYPVLRTSSSTPLWRRIFGRPKRKEAPRRVERMSVRSGSRLSSMRSGQVSSEVAVSGIQQWLSRAVEGSNWRSRPRSPREWGTDNLKTVKGEGIDTNNV